MKSNNNQLYGIIGTVAFHALLFLILWRFALCTPLPLPEERGVEVMAEMGGGSSSPAPQQTPTNTPPEPEPVAEETPVSTVVNQEVTPSNETPVVTQATEETVTATELPKQDKPKPVVDPNALYKPKKSSGESSTGTNTYNGSGSGSGSGSGTGSGDGDGSKIGDGKGDGWFLKGRRKLHLEKPPYNSAEQGIVVVEIIVDRNGKVVRATPGVKVPDENISTTVSDQNLWKLAKNAALQSKFSANPNAPEGQKGYIVYDFIKMH